MGRWFKSTRQLLVKKAIIFSLLTIFLVFLAIFGGTRFLIHMATFLGELKSSKEFVETEKTTPPFPPKLRPLPEATNSEKITLQGFAEPGATVKIFLNEEVKKEVIADADGSFMVEEVELSLGRNKIKAKAINQAGNESQDSGVIIIEYDKTPPELEIEKPKEEKETKIVGKTEPGVTLKINAHLVILDPEGNFSYPLTLLEGENKVLIEAEDLAGNKTSQSLTLVINE